MTKTHAFSSRVSIYTKPQKKTNKKKKVNKYIRTKNYKKKVKKSHKIFIPLLVLFIVSIISSTFGAVYGVSYLQGRAEHIAEPGAILSKIPLATELYDRSGVKLFRLQNDYSNSDRVDPLEITNTIRAVFMAAEDSEFYNHPGVNPTATIRCAVNTLLNKNKCGGSTITQQVVKITTKQSQATLERKIDEALLASKIETQYTKEQIFQIYLNITPYGSNITGLKTASRFYFGVDDLRTLTLAQVVTLAAIVNDPIDLSPTLSSDIEKARKDLKNRENYIYEQLTLKLDSINDQLANHTVDTTSIISLDQINAAQQEVVEYTQPAQNEIKAGHFVNYAITELQKRNYKYGKEPFTLEDLQTGGYKIYTSLDYNLQLVAERYTQFAGNNYKYWNVYNAGVMTAIPSTGEIITMAGSRSFTEESEGCDEAGQNCKFNPEVNVLTSTHSPGSTNKTLAYAIAYSESLLSPGSFLPDIPINFGGYVPKNWDGTYLGVVNTTAREMLRKSRNIPALEVIQMIGVDKYIDTARKMGYTTYQSNDQYGPSVVLGGADVYPVEHAQAYGVFANGGDLVELNPIREIWDSQGNLVYKAEPARTPIFDQGAMYLLNQTLYNLDTGTGDTISWDGRDVAGKTGTTENNRDGLLIMYSPDFVTLGWAGNNNNESLDFNYGWPAFIVAPWLKSYMGEIGESLYFNAKTPFSRPADVYWGGGDCDYYGNCLGLKSDWLIAGREPARGDVVVGKKDNQWVKYYKMRPPEFQSFLDSYLAKAVVPKKP
jgi:penicillin-binding protein 1A